jgi:hypothetical protein
LTRPSFSQCGRETLTNRFPEARGGKRSDIFGKSNQSHARRFFPLPLRSFTQNSKIRLTKKYKQKLPQLCVLELLLRDSDSKNLAKEKGRRVRGRLKWYLSTPLLSLSLLAGAWLTL